MAEEGERSAGRALPQFVRFRAGPDLGLVNSFEDEEKQDHRLAQRASSSPNIFGD